MLCCTRICKAANCSQPGFGGNRISTVGDRFIAGEYARPLPVLNQVSVETEPYWFETGLLQENVQSRFPFSNRFRWKQNLTGWRRAYCTRMCNAASRSHSGFGGKKTGLPITIGLALWRLEVGAIGSSSLLVFRSGGKL